jgi:cytochrome P450
MVSFDMYLLLFIFSLVVAAHEAPSNTIAALLLTAYCA